MVNWGHPSGVDLDLLRDGYGRLAAKLDHLSHGLVEGRLLCPAIDASVVVLLLFVAEFCDGGHQLLQRDEETCVISSSDLIASH